MLLAAVAALPATAGVKGGASGHGIAKPEYSPSRIIVKFSSPPSVSRGPKGFASTRMPAVDALNVRHGVSQMRPVFRRAFEGKPLPNGLARKLDRTYLLELSEARDPVEVALEYSKLAEVEYAEPDRIRRASRVDPNDPYWLSNNSWGQNYRDQWDMEIMKCPDAWDIETGDATVVIAVVDTGIDYLHSDLAANIWTNPGEVPANGLDDEGNGRIDDVYGYDFAYKDNDPMDGNGHGTHVSGAIGAVGNNGIGIAGVNWQCKLMAVKGLDNSGNGFDSDLAEAIIYAANAGANVINMSWGGEGFSQTIHEAIEYAHAQGVVLCAAAGNFATDLAAEHPACDNYVITVTATDPSDEACPFTNWGIKASVAAPGGNGYLSTPACAVHNCLSLRAGTTDPLSGECGPGTAVVGGEYYRMAGTSMACPHVSGLAGLVLAAHPTWSNEQVRQAIQMRADDVRTPGFDKYSGFGRVNAYSTITSAEPMTAFVSSPNSSSEVSGTVAIWGTARGPGLASWTLDYGAGHQPSSWSTIATGFSAVVRGKLADWDVTGVSNQLYTLRLRVVGQGTETAEFRIGVTPKSTEGSGHFTELYDTAPFDLAYTSLQFVPDGSDEYYSLCTRQILQLPTDPAGGTQITLADDDSALVTLTSGAQISLYGNMRTQFYVGGNGYVTLDVGDSSYAESYFSHFSRKRVAALFDDLIPGTGVSWKQLTDRVAVTYLNVREYGATTQNTFQIELFFDGRITVSYLNIAASDGLVGLSAGSGVPADFVESDLSGYPKCLLVGRALTIVKPNGGECYEPGTTARIIWSYSGNNWQPSDRVKLEYSPDAGGTWSPIPGAQSVPYNAGFFNWVISGLPQTQQYRVRITFVGDVSVTDESNGDFTVGPDTAPPVIIHTPLGNTANATGPYYVFVEVSDNVGIASAELHWSKNGGPYSSVSMTSAGPGAYYAGIPGPSVVGDGYCYYVEATDSSSSHNVGRLPSQVGQSFCFDVIDQSDYFTQTFSTGELDIENMSIEFTPDGSRSFYAACSHPIDELPTDPTGGAVLPLGDDNYTRVDLQAGELISFYGQTYGSFYVGSNGYITFDSGDSSREVLLQNHFALRRISALFADLYASEDVSWRQLTDRVAVTFLGVREYGTTNSNTFQVELFYNGKITLSYLTLEADRCVVGLSAGNGVPADYVASDLSSYPCGPRLTIVRPDGGELYEPGNTVTIQWTAVGDGWLTGDTVRLQASPDAGANWTQIPGAESLSHKAGSFAWNTSGWPMSSHYRVRVVSNVDPAVSDASDGDFAVALDTVAPVIVHTPLEDTNNTDGPYIVTAVVTDNLGIGTVTLYWRGDGGSYTQVAMTPTGVPSEYAGAVPGPSLNCAGGYCYYIEAADAASTPNVTRSPVTGDYCFEIVGATIGLSQGSLLFELPPGGTDSASVIISNNGCMPLHWSIVERGATSIVAEPSEAFYAAEDRPEVDWSAPHASGRLIVGVRPEVQSAQRADLHARAGAKVVHSFKLVSADLVEVDAGVDLRQVAAKYAAMPGVAFVEPDYIVSVESIPDDPMFGSQWGMHNTGQSGGIEDSDVDAPEAWGIYTGGRDVVVAVIDTGVSYTHPDLAANMWVNMGEIPGNGIDDDGNGFADDVHGYDFRNNDSNPADDNSHGTHVAGILGAVGGNSTGVAGVNWSTRIMALKFAGSSGSGQTSDAIKCIEYASRMGARLSCNSWGGGAYSQALVDAIAAAGNLGQLFVACAGNVGVDTDTAPYYPASYSLSNIISVAASDHNDDLAQWPSGGGSNWGLNTVDLAAPGLAVLSTVLNDGYGNKDGTSMAAPFVAGACALLKSANPDATCGQIKQWILDGVDEKPALAGKMLTGGRLNLHRSLLLAGVSWLDVSPKSGTVQPGGSEQITVSVDAAGLSDRFSETGKIALISNDYAVPVFVMPVTLSVVESGRFLRMDSPNGGEWYEAGTLVTVNWTPLGTDWQESDQVRLEYSSNAGSDWVVIPGAQNLNGVSGSFQWNTSGLPSSAGYLVRVVFPPNEGISDVSNATFTVAPDTVPPVISHSPLVDSEDLTGPYTVYAGVTDNYAVGSVTLYWKKNDGRFTAVAMSSTDLPDQYSGQIPGPSQDGDRYCYYIRAADASAAANTSVEPGGAPTQLRCFTVRSLVTLPFVLTDGDGFRWDIQQNGSISDGTSDAFDGGYVLSGFPNVSVAGIENDGREVVVDSGATTGVKVTRKIYVPSDRAYCRYLEIVTNLGDSPINHTVRIDTNLGSDNLTVIAGTSSGDSIFDVSDRWIVTDDADGVNDPSVTHVIAGPGAAVSPNVVSYTMGFVGYGYELPLAPYQTRIIMHFGAQGHSRSASLARAEQLSLLNAAQNCLAGMTLGERSQVANFIASGAVLRLDAPNGGEIYRMGDPVPILWTALGPDWTQGDTVRIECSPNGGSAWADVLGASALPYNSGSFNWNTAGLPASAEYRIRISRNGAVPAGDESDGVFTIAVSGSTRACKLQSDGVPVILDARRVSAVFAGIFYVQEEDRSCGIGVLWSGPMPSIGDLAAVRGVMVTVDGERIVDASAVIANDPDSLVPIPIGVFERQLGGGGLGYNVGPPPVGQRGIAGKDGLNNIGLLVKTWGRVDTVDPSPTPGFFILAHGFDRIRVDLPAGALPPTLGADVSVVGISSCYFVGDELHPKIRLRSSGDLVVL